MSSSHPQTAGRRLLAVLGAAALSVGAFALPAAAQTPLLAEVSIPGRISPAQEGVGGLTIEFGDDFTEGTHNVSAKIAFDPESGLYLAATTPVRGGCGPDATTGVLICAAEDADNPVEFAFRYGADFEAVLGDHDYTVTIAVDGVEVESFTQSILVEAPLHPLVYRHSPVDLGDVEPGGSADANPVFLQQEAVPADAAAVIASFQAPPNVTVNNEAVAIVADYDNCVPEEYGYAVHCIITDFDDEAGQALTFTDPVTYRLAEDAPGPFDHCDCEYAVHTAMAAEVEDRFGAEFLDLDGDLLGLTETDAGDHEFVDWYSGAVTLTATENTYDLEVEDANVKGDNGDHVSVDAPVTNNGPAGAYVFFDAPGTYVFLGYLPEGVSLVSAGGGVGWGECLSPDTYEHHLGEIVSAEKLELLDFACTFQSLEAGDSLEMTVTVTITDAKSKDVGTLEVLPLQRDGYPGVFEGDLKDNVADFTVNGNGNGSGKLPTTGSSLTMDVGIAALVLVAGAVLLVLTARKRRTTAAE